MRLQSAPSNPNDKFKVNLPEGVPKLPCLAVVIGKRGQGKTVLATKLIKWYVKNHAVNHVYVISPTASSQKHLWDWLGIADENILNVSSGKEVRDAVSHIVEEIKTKKTRFDSSREYFQAYSNLLHGRQLSPREADLLEVNQCREPMLEPYPKPIVLMDDLSHFDRVLTSSWFTNLCLRHRHLCDGVGVSLVLLLQSLKGGLARPTRQNASLIILFGTHDLSALEDLYKECSHVLTKERFFQIFRDATNDPHGFLSIDLSQQNPDRVFSKNLEKYYAISNNDHDRQSEKTAEENSSQVV
jgi:hypothetical protein